MRGPSSGLAKATAPKRKRMRRRSLPCLAAAALLFLIAGVVVLCMTLALALATLVGPLAGGLIAALVTFAHRRPPRPVAPSRNGEAQVSETPKVSAARIEVARTRAALIDTARELQVRLQPKTLANEAWEKAKIKGADLAEDAVDAVRSAGRSRRRGRCTDHVPGPRPIKDATSKFYDAMTSLRNPSPRLPR